jgi:hypothetical protein
MAQTLEEILMAQHCPNFQPRAMPLARVETPQVLEAEYIPVNSAIAPMPAQQTEFTALAQKLDSHHKFVADGFSHLVTQGQSFESRLTQLEQRQPAPIAQYQQPQADITPALLAIAQQNQQTQLVLAQMAQSMQKIGDRPTVVNHFVDNTVHNDSHEVIVHGNNYGNICTDGVQRNGGNFLMFLFAAVVTMIIGASIYGK